MILRMIRKFAQFTTLCFLVLLVLIEAFFLWHWVYPSIEISPFFLRDYQRTLALLGGQFVFVGPDFSSGGYNLGPFLYFLMAIPLLINKSLKAVVIFFFFLKILSQLIFSRYFSKFLQIPISFIYLFFATSSFLLERTLWMTNATLIGPLTQISLVFLFLYWNKSRPKIAETASLGFFLGCVLQVYFSLILLIPAALLILKRKPLPYLKHVLSFLLGLTLTLLPFSIAYLNTTSLSILDDGPIFILKDLGASSFIFDWIRLYSKPWRLASAEMNIFKWDTLFVFTYIFVKAILILARVKKSERNLLDQLALFLAGLTLLMSAWVLSGSHLQYFTVLYVPILLLLTIDLYKALLRTFKKQYFVYISACLICSISIWQFTWFQNILGLSGRCESCLHQLHLVCSYFNDRDISYEQFSSSTYEFFSGSNSGSLQNSHFCFKKQTGYSKESTSRYLFVTESFLLNSEEFNTLLERLPDEMHRLYSASLKPVISTDGFTMFATPSLENLHSEMRYSNLTFPYTIDPGLGEFGQLKQLLKPNETLYKVSFCSFSVYCDLYLFSEVKGNSINLRFVSRLFQAKTELGPISARITQAKLHYVCDGENGSFPFASTFGATFEEQNQTLLGPLKTILEKKCTTFAPTAISSYILELILPGDEERLKDISLPFAKVDLL